jgi:hypothetical protein
MSVGTTRIAGHAGCMIDLKMYLSGDLAEANAPLIVSNLGWQYGTSAGQVNVIYADTVTLADGANTTIDLYASGSYLDIFQRALTMEAIKFLYLKNNSADATLQAFGGASNDIGILLDTSDKIGIGPGGHFMWTNVTAAGLDITTNKNLYLVHDGTGSDTMDVDIIAMGLD